MDKLYTPAAIPPDEAFRLESLRQLDVLDTLPETEFDALAKVASLVCGAPISLISLIDVDRQWVKASVGAEAGAEAGAGDVPRDMAFCAHAILGDEIFEVPDTLQDNRFAGNPLVAAGPEVRFYAGCPIVLSNGAHVGTLCVIDQQPKQLNAQQRDVLIQLGIAAAHALEARRALLAERRLILLESRAQAVLAHSVDAIISTDLQGNVMQWNPAAQRIFGISEPQALGQTLKQLTPAPHVAFERDTFALLKAHPDGLTYETERLNASGLAMALSVSLAPNRDTQGRLIGATEIVHDISERKGYEATLIIAKEKATQAEQSLALERQRLMHIIEGTNVGTWEWNVATGEYIVNERWAGMLGYAVQELAPITADTWKDLLHPDDATAVMEALKWHWQMGQVFHCEFRLRCKNERWLWVLGRGAVYSHTLAGAPEWMSGTNLDITRRKMAELELEQLNGALKLSVKSANEASRSKSQFLANMSHEIRTPMNAVLGMLNLLEKTTLTPQQDDYVGKTKGAAKSLLGLLNDILDLSKVEAGKMELDVQPFLLENMMQDVSVILSAYVGTKMVEVLFDIDSALPEVLIADAPRLQQVLINLAGNAIKFTATGEVVVGLKLLGQIDDVVAIELSIKDSGIGIAPEHQAHIFTGFSQAEASTTRKFGGTGLGLAISQRLVQLMGGQIYINSTVGVGSTFSFVLSLPVAKDVPQELQRVSVNDTAPRTVLVVDDNPVAANLTAQMTRSLGWPTAIAGNGQEALELIEGATPDKAFPYQIIYLDWHMPGMDGWELAQRIRQLSQGFNGQAPVIVMVAGQGRASIEHRTSQEQAALNAFLVKPVTASMLKEAALGDANRNQMRDAQRVRSSERHLQGMRLLVVEDNLINQQVAEELLLSEGALVSLAANGRLGVDAVAAANPQFDVVLMDLQMPVMDGYEATRVIREELGLRTLPIVAMTANAMSSDRDDCIAAGMTEHVGKPFDLPKLVLQLLKVSGRARYADDTPLSVMDSSAPLHRLATSELIDVVGALARMSGRESLYLRSANDFSTSLVSEVSNYCKLVVADRVRAAMQMHTLKGTAALLGAHTLAKEAHRLERLCYGATDAAELLGQADGLQVLIERTRAALVSVIAELQVPIDGAEGNNPDLAKSLSDEDATEVLSALAVLEPLLAVADFAALEQFAEMRGALEKIPTDLLVPLEDAMQTLELEAAHVACKRILQTLKGSASDSIASV